MGVGALQQSLSIGTGRDQATAVLLSRAHGLFNVVTGLWPVVHMRSFEAVSGRRSTAGSCGRSVR